MGVFVQLGATRDGIDAYLRIAREAGMKAILIETPDYILLRQELGRQEFDRTLAVEQPADPQEVLEALEGLGERPELILAGFERYIYSAYEVAKKLQIRPFFAGDEFVPLNKGQQREAIASGQTSILQPRYCVLNDHQPGYQDLERFNYPIVVKPVDGGGGLGVFLAANRAEVELALDQLEGITNYDGGEFQGTAIEEYVAGDEYSVQGVVNEGQSSILTFCKKCIVIEQLQNARPLHGFREIGHIATRGDRVDEKVKRFVQECVELFHYKNGPFHIDMVETERGYYFLEMGFRLSGFGIVRLAQNVSGYDWAKEAFEANMGKAVLQPAPETDTPCMGQFTAVQQEEIEAARRLQQKGRDVEVQLFTNTPVKTTSARLKADLSRHGGTVGRIIIAGSTQQEVEELLHSCSPTRVGEKILPV